MDVSKDATVVGKTDVSFKKANGHTGSKVEIYRDIDSLMDA
jgi:hypothetical protein